MTTHPQTFQEILIQGASKYPDGVAVVSQGQSLTYRELAERSALVAEALQKYGISQGDRVAVLLPNSWEFVVAFFGIILAGGIVVPFNPTIPPEEFETLARDSGVRALVLDRELLPPLQSSIIPAAAWQVVLLQEGVQESNGLANELPIVSLSNVFESSPNLAIYQRKTPNPEVVVSITYTNGWAGVPKGVMHSHQSWLCGAVYISDYLQLEPQRKIVNPLHLQEASSFRHMLASLATGGTIILAADLSEGVTILQTEAPDALLVVPTDFSIILETFRELREESRQELTMIAVGTGRFSTQQLVELKALLPHAKIILPYSLTEAPVGFLLPGADPSQRVIKAIKPGLDVRVVTKRGYHVVNGQIGEIVIRGDGLMVGYWGSTLGEARHYKHWGYATGDLGRVMPDGSILLLGRADKNLTVGRLNLSLVEIEHVINRHPGVFQAAILSATDPDGEQNVQLTAQVVLKKGVFLSAASLIHYCQERLEPDKVPAEIQFCASLGE